MEFKQINNFQPAPCLLKTHYMVDLALEKYLSQDYIYIRESIKNKVGYFKYVFVLGVEDLNDAIMAKYC